MYDSIVEASRYCTLYGQWSAYWRSYFDLDCVIVLRLHRLVELYDYKYLLTWVEDLVVVDISNPSDIS
ncbi:MAG: hypothetical protein DRJ33_06905 [Candidatus Methanomethylicota archaeon]|uniref:Uncharacterized protein n=1 Tax=Thermoproteota archaeon TaxID=2056631 RepID=A0A497EUU6_9CREN|nr:MAG: hypothetical protein DRJ33_06905 [Candidatus Verstraetearchaeota archaeon]